MRRGRAKKTLRISAATPLEFPFDLTFVAALSLAATKPPPVPGTPFKPTPALNDPA